MPSAATHGCEQTFQACQPGESPYEYGHWERIDNLTETTDESIGKNTYYGRMLVLDGDEADPDGIVH